MAAFVSVFCCADGYSKRWTTTYCVSNDKQVEIKVQKFNPMTIQKANVGYPRNTGIACCLSSGSPSDHHPVLTILVQEMVKELHYGGESVK
jgi:hypothetical protein